MCEATIKLERRSVVSYLHSHKKVVEISSLYHQLQGLEDGTLAPTEVELLINKLNTSRAARRLYLEYFQDAASLRHYAQILNEQGKLPLVNSSSNKKKELRFSMMAAAAAVALLAVIGTLYQVVSDNPTLSTAAIMGTKWSMDGVARGADLEEINVQPGTLIEVESGTVRLKYPSGSSLILQGPAIVSFPTLNKPLLSKGWLWIETGESNASFEVTTPDLLVRDIGTRFGVRVPEEGPTEVHLVDGKVEVISRKDGRNLTSLEPDDHGYEIQADGKRNKTPLVDDPFPSLPKLLKAKQSYSTTLLSQAPAGYWKLDETQGAELENEIPNKDRAKAVSAVVIGESGVGSEGDYPAFGKENRSARFTGEEWKSLISGINSPSGTSRKEGAVSFWIRRTPDISHEEVLWLAGTGTAEITQPRHCLIYTSLTPSGHVRLFIENGKPDFLLSSSENIADARWHHIAASWGPTGVFLYVDGIQADQNSHTQKLKEATSRDRHVRFGKPSYDLVDQNLIPYKGWADEIALWNRPLTETEVKLQFNAASEKY